MKTVTATEFKEQCLELLDELEADGLLITRNGKPVARITLYEEPETDEEGWKRAVLNGSLRDKISVHGDIFSTGIRWDAES